MTDYLDQINGIWIENVMWMESLIQKVGKDMVEWAGTSLILEFISIFITIILVALIHRQVKSQVLNIEHQNKVASANLLWNFIRRLQEDDFRAANKSIKNDDPITTLIHISFDYTVGSIDEKYDVLIPRFLNHFDRMSVFEEDGVVMLKQIEEMFGTYIRNIKNSDNVKKFIENRQEKVPKDFIPLQRLLEKIN